MTIFITTLLSLIVSTPLFAMDTNPNDSPLAIVKKENLESQLYEKMNMFKRIEKFELPESERPIHKNDIHIRTVKISPNNRFCVMGAIDSSIYTFKIDCDGLFTLTKKILDKSLSYTMGNIPRIRFSPNSRFFAVEQNDANGYIYKIDENGVLTHKQPLPIQYFDFSPDNEHFASVIKDGIIGIYKINQEIEKQTPLTTGPLGSSLLEHRPFLANFFTSSEQLKTPAESLRDITYSPNGQHLIALSPAWASYEKPSTFIFTKNNSEKWTLTQTLNHSDANCAYSLDIHPSSRLLAVTINLEKGFRNNVVQVYEMNANKIFKDEAVFRSEQLYTLLKKGRFTWNSTFAATINNGQSISIYSIGEDQSISHQTTIRDHKDIHTITSSPNGKFLAILADSRTKTEEQNVTYIYRQNENGSFTLQQKLDDPTLAIGFSPDNNLFVNGSCETHTYRRIQSFNWKDATTRDIEAFKTFLEKPSQLEFPDAYTIKRFCKKNNVDHEELISDTTYQELEEKWQQKLASTAKENKNGLLAAALPFITKKSNDIKFVKNYHQDMFFATRSMPVSTRKNNIDDLD